MRRQHVCAEFVSVMSQRPHSMRIVDADLNFEREALSAPMGFKGGYLSELWQVVCTVRTDSGVSGIGLGVQSVLWSDAKVFVSNSESGGNALMLAITARALQLCVGIEFSTPIDLLDYLLPLVTLYGQSITGRPNLRTTFLLNALVALDNAVWMAYAAECGIDNIDHLIPGQFRPGLASRHHRVVSIPTLGYGVAIEAISKLVDEGCYLLKIKIGSDPARDGDQEKMLAWDMHRISEIHRAVGHRHAGPDERHRTMYYLDANQRYDGLDRVMRLIEHVSAIGALEQTVLLEEPFAEEVTLPVHAIPLRVVVDESGHTVEDVDERTNQGYGAIALKPVAKTLSMTLKVVERAFVRNVGCFCADLTVNPVLVDWNKSIAARCPALPGLPGGALENNGRQNYRNWDTMMSYHPRAGASWTTSRDGEFHLDDDFFNSSGGMLLPSQHYSSLVNRG